MSGIGKGLVEEARAAREAAIEELRAQREDQRAMRQRGWDIEDRDYADAREERIYSRNRADTRADRAEDRQYADEREQRIYDRGRADSLEDRDTQFRREDEVSERDWTRRKDEKADDRTYEAGREERRERRTDDRMERQRGWSVEDREIGRSDRVGEREAARDARREERGWQVEDRDLARDDAREERAYKETLMSETTVTADGRVAVRNPVTNEVVYLKDATGKDIIVGTGGKTGDPADIQSARQLAAWNAAAEGREPTAEDFVKAYEKVKGGGISPTERAKAIDSRLKIMTEDWNDKRTPEEKRRAATEEVDAMLGTSAPEKPAGRRGLMPAEEAPAANAATPPGMMPPMPGTNGMPADLPTGAVIRHPKTGTRWRWTGTTYEPAQ